MGNKIQKIFVGTNLVRPKWEYSYDFRNKTWAECQADGWLNTGSTPSVGADGIYYNSWVATPYKSLETFTGAKRVTVTYYFNTPSNFDGLGPRICVLSGTSFANATGAWIGYNNFEVTINNSVKTSQSKTPGTGWHTLVTTYDLVNKTYQYSNYISISGSLTDTEVTAIRSMNCIYLMLSKVTVGTISVKVEY